MSEVIKVLEPVDIVLDIGCGIVPQEFIHAKIHICCEPFPQYIDYLKKKIHKRNDRIFVLVNADWSEAVKLFPKYSVDSVVLVDVIEHLEKSEALELLRATEQIARRQIAIFTPLGFIPQCHRSTTDAWGFEGGRWQEHKSGWLPEDFEPEWSIYASKVFHTHNSDGKIFNKPYGAMWAVKTKNPISPTDQSQLEIKKNLLYGLTNRLIDRSPGFVIHSMYAIVNLISKVIRL